MNILQAIYFVIAIILGAYQIFGLIRARAKYWRRKPRERERKKNAPKLITSQNTQIESRRSKAAINNGMTIPRYVAFILVAILIVSMVLTVLAFIYRNDWFMVTAILLGMVNSFCLWLAGKPTIHQISLAGFTCLFALGLSSILVLIILPKVIQSETQFAQNPTHVVAMLDRQVKLSESQAENVGGIVKTLSLQTKTMAKMAAEIEKLKQEVNSLKENDQKRQHGDRGSQ